MRTSGSRIERSLDRRQEQPARKTLAELLGSLSCFLDAAHFVELLDMEPFTLLGELTVWEPALVLTNETERSRWILCRHPGARRLD